MLHFNFGNLLQPFFTFLKKLFIARWRSLLILLIGIYLPLQIFGLLAVEVWRNKGGFPWDVPILMAVHATKLNLDVFAVKLTKFGSIWTVLPFVATIALFLLIQQRWRSLTYLLTTGVGSVIINRTAKELMHRVRPHLWNSPAPEYDYAFPSGHAMTSMTLVATLIILTWGSPWCVLILILGSLYVVAIAWTRLYLGVHFPSDILAGWLVSIAWAIGVSLLIRPHLKKTSITNEYKSPEETSLLPEESAKQGEVQIGDR